MRPKPDWWITVRLRGGTLRILVESDSDELHEKITADSRGRITLGHEYAGETVSVAVVEREQSEE